ncbi:RecBCD enzyme subunit RecC [Buchnera aphidicola (Protaphis terricola)]|uniref:exodeoxyribonuclease V subunit gamma n=1 Tax=Buchnera aphidicola TaxID=9 RepID=UPI003464BF5C
MLFLYKFNQLNTMFLKICKIIKNNPLPNIFEQETIIHDNNILFEYLNIFNANYTGISSDFKLIHPKKFIWNIFKQIKPEIKKEKILKKTTNIWKIFKLIEKNNFLKNIIVNTNKIKKFEFSLLIENLFQQYILYRPIWINEWEKKEKKIFKINFKETWQIKLWNKIINDNKKLNQSYLNFSNLFSNFKNLIKKKILLPKRIFIIWSISINPSYIKIFQKISIHTDIYFLYLTSYKNNINYYTYNSNKKLSNNYLNNTLEILWGKYAYIYLSLIKNFKNIKTINYFKEYSKNNLLNKIKNNILNFKQNQTVIKQILNPKDHSISINICYNKRHEIEVLYKTLIKILNKDTNIKPSDIVITSFSLNDYIKDINCIFKLKNNKEKIPFYISSQNSKKIEKILYIFNKILDLSNIRFNNEEILELLNIPIFAKNFNISKEEIIILYRWIEETNIRWGIDKKYNNYLYSLKIYQNTWFYGIKKLLLNYAINEKNKIWNNILSLISIDFSKPELIGKLIHLINILKKWQYKLTTSKYPKNWRLLFQSFIKDFFYNIKEYNNILEVINKHWEKMIDQILLSKYLKKIPIYILKKNFSYIINSINKKKFKIGHVNFCHPSLICYIPFKLIYIIGLNDKEQSKENNIDHFNFLKKYSNISDINVNNVKYYLFLQNFISAQKYFYISYIGYSLNDENKIPPSIIIDQLIKHIALNFYFKENINIKFEENIKKISKNIFKIHKKEHLYKKICIKKNKIKNSEKIINNINKIFFKKIINIQNINQKPIVINLNNLITFWKNPIRYFFNFTLQTKFKIRKKLSITEPFIINQIDNFTIGKFLLKKLINKEDKNNIFKYIILSGKLPYGSFGEIALEKKYKEIKEILKIINKYRIFPTEKNINLKIKKYHINGNLKEIQETGLLRWKTGTINNYDKIALWLEHLVYCISGGIGESKIIGYKNKIFSYSYIPYDIAYHYLYQYIKGYIEGIKHPLLLTKSGIEWFNIVYDTKNHCIYKNYDLKKKAYKILYKTWIGNSYIQGEKEDIYIKKIIKNLNIKKICNISQKWLTPIFRHKKNQ